MNSPPVPVNIHRFLASSSNLIWPYAYSKSSFVIQISPSFSFDISRDILDISTSMIGIWIFLCVVASFNFLESKSYFIVLSFFTVMTAGLTQQSSEITVSLSKKPFLISRLIPSGTWSSWCICIGVPFCCIIFASCRCILTDRFLFRCCCKTNLRFRSSVLGFSFQCRLVLFYVIWYCPLLCWVLLQAVSSNPIPSTVLHQQW